VESLAFERAATFREPTARQRIVTRIGRTWAGLTAIALAGGVVYVIRFGGSAPGMPWRLVAAHFVTFAVVTGFLISALTLGALAAGDAVLRGRGRRFHPPLSGALGGAAATTLPGAIACGYFGSMPQPYMGSVTIGACVAAAVVLVAWMAAREPGVSARRALGGVAAASLAIGSLAVAFVVIDGDPFAYEVVAPLYIEHGGALMGAAAGAGSGALAGACVGTALSIARSLARSR
jgi:hypothetical protein